MPMASKAAGRIVISAARTMARVSCFSSFSSISTLAFRALGIDRVAQTVTDHVDADGADTENRGREDPLPPVLLDDDGVVGLPGIRGEVTADFSGGTIDELMSVFSGDRCHAQKHHGWLRV